MVHMEEAPGKLVHFAATDPLLLELDRLQNQLKDKDRELGVAHGEIKALKVTELLKDKAIEELSYELRRLDEKLQSTENLLEEKNIEIKKLISEKKEALAAQFAAEAALRRIHANCKDEDSVPFDAIIAPLEADIKMYKNEIMRLQEDNKAMERLSKAKEAALLEAEKILKSAMERVLIVEDIQNQNFDLRRQIEIVQEENKVLDRTNRQKVVEVDKLSQTIRELEESILAGGSAANAVRDYQRQISELNEERRTLERELARAKVSANRVATVVASGWKDDNDKVMPVKQWLDERRFLQGEMQRLKDKLAVSERTAKAEAQLKDKLRVRLKTLEEGLKHASSFPFNSVSSKSETEKYNAGPMKRSTSQPRASLAVSKSSPLQQPNMRVENSNPIVNLKRVNSLKMKYVVGENMFPKKTLWASRSKLIDVGGKENSGGKANRDANSDDFNHVEVAVFGEIKEKTAGELDSQTKGNTDTGNDDFVSGFLYDRLQREVISLRKTCEGKDGILNAKDDEIELLLKKVDALTKSMEVEVKKMKREVAAREKEATRAKLEEIKQKPGNTNTSRRSAYASSISNI